MRLASYACLGGTEIGNSARTGAYSDFLDACACEALEFSAFTNPADDDAPWYDAAHPESGDFLGFYPQFVELSTPTQRETRNALDEGAVVGREQRPGRIVEMTGWMVARDMRSMWWGERWITQVLRGRLCQSGCSGDELTLLPFCREADDMDDDFSQDFRTLVGAGLIDGPHWDPIADDDYLIQTGQVQIATAMPWLYGPVATPVDGETVAASDTGCELVTTESWFAGEALVIQVAAGDDGLSSPGVTVTMTYSLDGTCPEDRISASMFFTIPELVPNASVTVDAMRNRISYGNPVAGGAFEPGYDKIEWNGPFCWPVVPACSSMCVCVTNESTEDVTWTLQRAIREL